MMYSWQLRKIASEAKDNYLKKVIETLVENDPVFNELHQLMTNSANEGNDFIYVNYFKYRAYIKYLKNLNYRISYDFDLFRLKTKMKISWK